MKTLSVHDFEIDNEEMKFNELTSKLISKFPFYIYPIIDDEFNITGVAFKVNIRVDKLRFKR